MSLTFYVSALKYKNVDQPFFESVELVEKKINDDYEKYSDLLITNNFYIKKNVGTKYCC